jgi:hypothetical protein
MENKKLLKYLLKDLSELDEMFAEKEKNSFDELEMEFIQNRVTGAKRLVQLFFEHENDVPANAKSGSASQQKTEFLNPDLVKEKAEIKIEEITPEIKPEVKSAEIKTEEKIQEVIVDVKTPGVIIQESVSEIKSEEKKQQIVAEEEIQEIKIEEKIQVIENKIVPPEIVKESEVKTHYRTVEEIPKQSFKISSGAVQQELQLEEEEPVDIHNKRLGDSFSKEKSVNDLMSDDFSNLEHKLSNRPVTSIQSSIGINDRFQFIRELFEGSADNFVKTVADLDSMNDIKEAVNYLQSNFKWKKNETSLKFVSLIKRRFPNE